MEGEGEREVKVESRDREKKLGARVFGTNRDKEGRHKLQRHFRSLRGAPLVKPAMLWWSVC